MTRSELVRHIARLSAGITLAQADHCVSIFFNEIAHVLCSGGRVELRGFGVFEVRKRKARLGRNPRTGEAVKIIAKSVPFFKAGKQLRLHVNGQD